MQKLFLSFFLASCALTLWAQDSRSQASQLNKQAAAKAEQLASHTYQDSILYFRTVADVVSLSLQCDELDKQPNRKGDIKPKFEKNNHERLTAYRPHLIDAGIFFVRERFRDEGIAAWKLYLKTTTNALTKDMPDESGIAAYYIAQTELLQRSYKAADRYADIALRYDETAQHAAEIKAQCMAAQMTCDEDSVRYLSVLTQLYKTDPTNQEYFSWIMQFYSHPSKKHNLANFVDQQLEENPGSYVPWVLKGEIAMNAKRWEEAIEAYQQADQLKPNLIPIIYNIGVSLNNRVVEMQQTKTGTKAEMDNLLAQARNYLEQVRAKDPRQNKVKWIAPLYMAYVLLGDKIHAEELEPLVRGFK